MRQVSAQIRYMLQIIFVKEYRKAFIKETIKDRIEDVVMCFNTKIRCLIEHYIELTNFDYHRKMEQDAERDVVFKDNL